MPNRKYEAGRRLEYRVMKTLKENLPANCTVHRTSGSHTGADVIVIENRRAVKIQCKSTKSKSKKKQIENKMTKSAG